MKKIISLLLIAGFIGSVQARQIRINLCMPERPEKETRMECRCDDLRMEVCAVPCPPDCCSVEVTVYKMTPDGERMVCKSPCTDTPWKKSTCCYRSEEANDDVESIEVVAKTSEDDSATMAVEVE